MTTLTEIKSRNDLNLQVVWKRKEQSHSSLFNGAPCSIIQLLFSLQSYNCPALVQMSHWAAEQTDALGSTPLYVRKSICTVRISCSMTIAFMRLGLDFIKMQLHLGHIWFCSATKSSVTACKETDSGISRVWWMHTMQDFSMDTIQRNCRQIYPDSAEVLIMENCLLGFIISIHRRKRRGLVSCLSRDLHCTAWTAHHLWPKAHWTHLTDWMRPIDVTTWQNQKYSQFGMMRSQNVFIMMRQNVAHTLQTHREVESCTNNQTSTTIVHSTAGHSRSSERQCLMLHNTISIEQACTGPCMATKSSPRSDRIWDIWLIW